MRNYRSMFSFSQGLESVVGSGQFSERLRGMRSIGCQDLKLLIQTRHLRRLCHSLRWPPELSGSDLV